METVLTNQKEFIAQKTINEIRTFLSELLHGTRNYESMYNLTEQMTHDYANRFIIELLQNAYDAISSDHHSPIGKIKIILDEKENQPSTLYFANTGAPFSHENFESLASLALSSKDPKETIGNKGIGFKSVLQVSDSPKVYSGAWQNQRFSGYCFEFNPEKIQTLSQLIVDLYVGNDMPTYEELLHVHVPLVDWDDRTVKTFREKLQEKSSHPEKFIHETVRRLSPYILPLPTEHEEDEILAELGEDGYVSVIKLPLNQADALENTKHALRELQPDSILFLDNLAELSIVHRGQFQEDDVSRHFLQTHEEKPINKLQINKKQIHHLQANEQYEFITFSKHIGGEKNPLKQQEIIQAANQLHGKWVGIGEAKIEIAVPITAYQPKGNVYIFLPTKQTSGLAFHINAPFFGQMNRKDIDFSLSLNTLYVKEAAQILFEAMQYFIQHQPENYMNSIIDLISFQAHFTDMTEILYPAFIQILDEHGIEWTGWDVFPYFTMDNELQFGSMREVFLLPQKWDFTMFSRENLVANAAIKLIPSLSEDRLESIRRLANLLDVDMAPNHDDKANWAEKMANYLLQTQAPIEKWQQFYEELPAFVQAAALVDKYIVLGQDENLHRVPNEKHDNYVFFPPSQGKADEKKEDTGIVTNLDVPAFLAKKIAYFHPEIELYRVEQGSRVRTAFYVYLQSIMEEFSIENIIQKVILQEMPEDTVPLHTEISKRLYALLEWSMSLYFGARSRPESIRDSFKELYVPCQGGWKKANQTYFSTSWDESFHVNYGHLLTKYFQNPNNGPITQGYEKLVLDFSDLDERIRAFGLDRVAEFFQFCGVVDHLKLVPAVPDGKITISGQNRYFHFPEHVEGEFLPEQIQLYRDYFRGIWGEYVGFFHYEVRNLLTVEGFHRYGDLTEEGKELFAKLIVISISKWSNWEESRIVKRGGAYWTRPIDSLLKLSLQQMAWIPNPFDQKHPFNTPKKMWYIPSSSLRVAAYTYAVLPYMDDELARLLENEHALEKLQEIGLGSFEITSVSEGCRLLDQLADSLRNNLVANEKINYFKNHYRFTWEQMVQLYDEDEFESDGVITPNYVVVTKGGDIQSVPLKNRTAPIYKPDDKKLFMQLHDNPNLSILLIDTKKKFAPLLNNIFGDALTNLTELEQSFYVDGHKWTPEMAEALDTNLIESPRDWLLPFIMTIAVYREDSNLTISGERFKELVTMLKTAKWYECTELVVLLASKNGEQIEKKSEKMTVCKETKTFIIAKEGLHTLEDFASSIREYFEIAPIELPLRFAFSKLDIHFYEEPDESALITALQQIKITKENYETIKRLVHDHLQWVIELMPPALVALDEKFAPEMLLFPMLESEQELKQYILRYMDDSFVIDELIKFAKESKSLQEFGFKLYEQFDITLEKWNRVLEPTNQSVKNEDVVHQFLALKEAYQSKMLAIVRHLVKNKQIDLDTYIAIKTAYEAWSMPDEWSYIWWNVEENTFVEVAASFLNEQLLDIPRKFSTKDELEQFICDYQIDVTASLEISRHNHQVMKKCLQEVQRAVIYLCKKENTDIPVYWLQTEQTFIEHIKSNRAPELFEIKPWTTEEAFTYMFESDKLQQAFEEVTEIHATIHTYHDLLQYLEHENHIEISIDEMIEEEKEKKRREKRLVKINGEDFDTDESNLDHLHEIIGKFNYDQMPINGTIHQPISLKEMANRRKNYKPPVSSPTRNSKTKRVSKHIENVIGLAGELVIYHYLKENHKEDFRPEWWKSENSLHVYADNQVNDSLGYDFEVKQANKTYHIEVKATTGTDYSFQMGTSETRKAFEDAKKRHVEYIIAFITNVFDHPEIYWLPNPYSNEGKTVYNIKDAGVKISFKI